MVDESGVVAVARRIHHVLAINPEHVRAHFAHFFVFLFAVIAQAHSYRFTQIQCGPNKLIIFYWKK